MIKRMFHCLKSVDMKTNWSNNRSFSYDIISFPVAILVYHCSIVRAHLLFSSAKMNSKQKKRSCQNNGSVEYYFLISEYAKQLNAGWRSIFAENISIRIDLVLVENKDFKLVCLPPVEWTDNLCYLVLSGDKLLLSATEAQTFWSLEAYKQNNGLWFYRMHARPHHCIQFCCFG